MHLCIQCMIPHRGGLPHSDTPGSKLARSSSGIFAACHVLHRLLVPRHPPNALLLLNQSNQHRNNRRRRRGRNVSLRHRTVITVSGTNPLHARCQPASHHHTHIFWRLCSLQHDRTSENPAKQTGSTRVRQTMRTALRTTPLPSPTAGSKDPPAVERNRVVLRAQRRTRT